MAHIESDLMDTMVTCHPVLGTLACSGMTLQYDMVTIIYVCCLSSRALHFIYSQAGAIALLGQLRSLEGGGLINCQAFVNKDREAGRWIYDQGYTVLTHTLMTACAHTAAG